MATQLLALAVGGASSADFTLTEPTLLTMIGQVAARGSKLVIQLKLSAGTYRTVAIFQGKTLSGVLPAGIYRSTRLGPNSIGLERA